MINTKDTRDKWKDPCVSNETPVTESAPVNYSRGRFNRTAIRRHLLKLSQVTRAGKFTRVSDDTINLIEAKAETKIRELQNATASSTVGQVDPDEQDEFLTGEGAARLVEAFTIWLAREMHRVVNDTRVGKTL